MTQRYWLTSAVELRRQLMIAVCSELLTEMVITGAVPGAVTHDRA